MLLAAPLRVVGAAVVPLLDNAVRHAAARVRVHVTVEPRRVLLHVEDDGERGGRATGGTGSSSPATAPRRTVRGSGSSLSRRLAHSVGGEVDEQGDGHGHFVLSVPRA